ncbi:hypothetical protein GCM10018953_28170 [Streptosporangium nondiastaticum]
MVNGRCSTPFSGEPEHWREPVGVWKALGAVSNLQGVAPAGGRTRCPFTGSPADPAVAPSAWVPDPGGWRGCPGAGLGGGRCDMPAAVPGHPVGGRRCHPL